MCADEIVPRFLLSGFIEAECLLESTVIVYNYSIVSIHQNLLKVVVHVNTVDQRNQTVRLYEIEVKVIYSHAIS